MHTTRRRALSRLIQGAISAPVILKHAYPASALAAQKNGHVVGERTAAEVGLKALAAGGNAMDAALAAALAASVASPHNCGPGGYGGHMVVAWRKPKRLVAIDFNTMAPAAAHPSMFLNADGKLNHDRNNTGWLSSGVPGTLAGIQLAWERFGSLPLTDLLSPAIDLARDGFPVTSGMARALAAVQAHLKRCPTATKLFFKNGTVLKAGEHYRNPELAELLQHLGKDNSLGALYSGGIADQIATAFQKNEGLVTAADLAQYRPREVLPLRLDWAPWSIFTAPLTAGGLTTLQMLAIHRHLAREKFQAIERLHARIETLRLAWRDRLQHLGDPEHATVPMARLLSDEYTANAARQIVQAVKEQKMAPEQTRPRDQGGTVHLSAIDKDGNMVAITLTHGASFGARVAVEGLGLVLGHGMSRFEGEPGHPNSPGPLKRPLHNMCPSIVCRDGDPVLALGGAGGRRIPNAVFDVVLEFIRSNGNFKRALAAPRVHSEGDQKVWLEKTWPEENVKHVSEIGYETRTGSSAMISAVVREPDGSSRSGSR